MEGNNTTKVLLTLIALIILILLAVLSTHVGGITIRNNVASISKATLSISEPIIRGVPVTLHWTLASPSDRAATVFFRDTQGESAIGEAALDKNAATVKVPCDHLDAAGAIIVRDKDTKAIIGTKEVVLLPPGPECVR